MLKKNLVKMAECLILTNDIWAELQAASVIDSAEVKRIKVLIVLLYSN